jgi:phosphoadenosine phosphosulfate reductase
MRDQPTSNREADMPAPTRIGSGDWLGSTNPTLQGFEPTDMEAVREMPLQQRVDRAIALLKAHEPAEGYYLGYSGGKDSDAILALAKMSGVKFDAWYNQTTIDPPEVVAHVKKHPEVKWNRPEMNMMTMVATAPKTPPTRGGRWCCEIYKEAGGDGRFIVVGVRAAESPRRKHNWKEVATDIRRNKACCPIVYWSDAQLWEFLRAYEIPYCKLYDEGFTRLGCVDCPLASDENRARERARWPIMANNWKKAIIANWEKYKDIPNTKTGLPRYQAKFKSGEDMYQWWITAKAPDYFREDCQGTILFTNEEPSAPDVLPNIRS